MQSQGSTSSQPSFDSLSSSDSLLFSDSDDTDVFLTDASSSALLEAAAAAGGTPATAGDSGRASGSPGSQWACDGFAGKEEEDDGSLPRQVPKSQGDLLFAQKCAELQGFVRPLLELLNGLKKGRFDRGLSSFQQSVAMDRIQRIVGVLQKPNSGERYLNTLLQVEMMLKLWFPQIATVPPSSVPDTAASSARAIQDTPGATPPHKHRDQLHIPVKKRRLSWTGTDSPMPSPGLPKCPAISTQEKKHQGDSEEEDTGAPAGSPCPCPPPPLPPPPPPPSSSPPSHQNPAKGNDSGSDSSANPSEYKTARASEPSLTWVHVAPILSPRKTGALALGGGEATQDSAVSSTTPPELSKDLKKAARCQSQAAAAVDDRRQEEH
ncbi:circadian-associated transcriptional repressor-like [Hippocampus zosterae]|uniref:circadian-associated transcriptional repressor-like n=1 Tax=Hippocampus zosterae TaxID=109293 RepID=UPI00223D9F46|nr:circadian-associated transcriptional repressor-like [Hippocampus zosterae]XP_051921211.1 circadian-associated transcriptional repressor-like [Hippocampus zosterae]